LAFQTILADLLAHTEGALAAIFVDWEGETVELMSARDYERDDLKIVAAQQAVFFTRLRRICENTSVGTPDRFKLAFARTTVLSCDVKDGYYVVLLLAPNANEGLAWQRLAKCRERLMAEAF
jgi:predicted regulator of Ras-like GTPase activity (Roadblock/LC7/MglB family)